MKILLLNPPKDEEVSMFVPADYGTKARSNQVPLGLLYLESYLRMRHDIQVLDMNALEMGVAEAAGYIGLFQPDLIGITCVIGKWKTVQALARNIKMNFNIPIVVGGVNPSLYPWETLQCKDIDFVVSGFGQYPMQELCSRIELGKNVDYTFNVRTRNNIPASKIRGEFVVEGVDLYPIPDRSILDINQYTMPLLGEGPVTSMLTSAGCPYKCNFCACKNFKPVTIRRASSIVSEMKKVEALGIKGVIFNDELFTMSLPRIREICTAIVGSGVKLNWAVRSRANLINKEALDLMKLAGCVNVHLGIESGTDNILERMKKGITVKLASESVESIKMAGLGVTASFMLGYPQETRDEIMQTIRFAERLDLDSAQFFITQPEPGTELYEEVRKAKGLPEDIYSDFVLSSDEALLRDNIASLEFTKEELEDFVKEAYSRVKNLYNIKGSGGS